MDLTLKEWCLLACDGDMAQAAIRRQAMEYAMDEDQVRTLMGERLTVMQEAVTEGLQPSLRSVSGMTGGQACRLMERIRQGRALCGTLQGKAEAYALATAECNAAMGRIVAAPTAGACGILPGVVLAMMEERDISWDRSVDALFVAAAIGQSIATHASISGAEGGCQAETGTGAAMAAAALCYLEGGSPIQCCHSAAFAIMNLLGLVCDPVGGLVEVPCVYRNVGAVSIAFSSADMVLSGIPCPLDPDEVIQAMKEVGDALPASLRETGEGGCAACRSGCSHCRMDAGPAHAE